MTVALSLPQRLRLGEILRRRGAIGDAQLQVALRAQEEGGGRLGEVLLKQRAITELQLAEALADQSLVSLWATLPKAEEIPIELLERVPVGFAKQHQCLVLGRDERGRVLAVVADPYATEAIDDLGVLLKAPVDAYLSVPSQILEHINRAYSRVKQSADLDHKKDASDDDEFSGDADELVDILDANDEAPIIRWVNSLMFHAVKDRASDIHIEPGEKEVVVRYRVDGNLREAKRVSRQFLASIIARVKIMAGLNIAEKRLPQDGRIRRKIAGKDVDMRVATVPTATGERITIRLLDRSSVLLGLADIGMATDILEQMRAIIGRPHGILLVTGPTGSGKTTTLYACLSEINAPDTNILTVEDPVEYQLEGISQTQVNSKIDLTFASGLRSFLRHDPDVIMVGEIRDKETAEIAITASLTGHFVFSTIHTNDAAGGITRLVDMGIEPFLVASSLVGLLAQRLVRRPCPQCAEPIRPNPEILRELGLDPDTFYRGGYNFADVKGRRPMAPGTMLRAVGCDACSGLGYRGRTGIYELLMIDEPVRRLALEKADAAKIRAAAVAGGMVSLRLDGARKCAMGMTTPEEVLMMTAEAD